LLRQNLKYLREVAGYHSQRALARAAGISNGTIAKVERGDMIPNVVLALRIASLLGADPRDIDWLAGGRYDLSEQWPDSW